MKRLVKALVVVLASLLVLPIFAFFAYGAFVFLPHRDDIQAILTRADPQDRAPPARVTRYIIALHQEGAPLSAIVARQLHSRFLPRKSMLRWHMRSVLWERLVSLHLSQEEILGLYSVLAYNGQGHGLNELSRRLFAKPLSALSDQEAATLVAFIWGPSLYAHYPDRFRARRDKLLARVRGGP